MPGDLAKKFKRGSRLNKLVISIVGHKNDYSDYASLLYTVIAADALEKGIYIKKDVEKQYVGTGLLQVNVYSGYTEGGY